MNISPSIAKYLSSQSLKPPAYSGLSDLKYVGYEGKRDNEKEGEPPGTTDAAR
jgi:hypothetical protein